MLSGLDPVTQQLLGGHGKAQPDLGALMKGGDGGGGPASPSAQTESPSFVWTVDVNAKL